LEKFDLRVAEDPLVSVIIPVFNGEEFVADAISSVLEGSYSNFELLVVDDCSIDNSVAIVSELCILDSRVRLIRLPKNSGVSEARNQGILSSKGRFVAFLDCDDFWAPEKLRRQIDFMLCNNVSFSFTSYFLVDLTGCIAGSVSAKRDVDFQKILRSNWIGCSTVVLKRELLLCYSFDNSTRREDYWLWMQILKSGVVAYGLSDILGFYRLHDGQSSKRKLEMAHENFKLYLKVHSGSYPLAIKSFLFYSFYGFCKFVRIHLLRRFSF
jgi:teichuronic acid biosynthesis glycosyltransferase TuaG